MKPKTFSVCKDTTKVTEIEQKTLTFCANT